MGVRESELEETMTPDERFKAWWKDTVGFANSYQYPARAAWDEQQKTIYRLEGALAEKSSVKFTADVLVHPNMGAMLQLRPSVVCTYCDKLFEAKERSKEAIEACDREVSAHVVSCEKNPLVAQLAEANADIERLRELNEKQFKDYDRQIAEADRKLAEALEEACSAIDSMGGILLTKVAEEAKFRIRAMNKT